MLLVGGPRKELRQRKNYLKHKKSTWGKKKKGADTDQKRRLGGGKEETHRFGDIAPKGPFAFNERRQRVRIQSTLVREKTMKG